MLQDKVPCEQWFLQARIYALKGEKPLRATFSFSHRAPLSALRARGRSAIKQEGLYQNKLNSSLVLNWIVTVHSTWLHDFTNHSAPISYPLIDALRLLLFAFVNSYYSFTHISPFLLAQIPPAKSSNHSAGIDQVWKMRAMYHRILANRACIII